MHAAASGESAALQRFFEQLLLAKFFVPQRKQNASLKNIAEYPNDFFNFLALKFDERVFVPVFSRLDDIAQWAGSNLEYREVESVRLFELMPPEWWMVINPGAEVHKEISPWEIERLKNGKIEIAEIIAELQADQDFEGFSVETPQKDEFATLKSALSQKAQGNSDIAALYLLKEQGRAANDQTDQRLLLGFELVTDRQGTADAVRKELQLLADQLQIGAEKVRIIFLSESDKSAKGIFMGVEPFYAKSVSAFSRLLSQIKRSLGLR